ncbi:MAG: TraR/DksA C4-type zinc finger protein [Chthoniobacterales bacterium]|nr:TraR/DksA C4-type zinc finger protein [Chthoniobacterales bacterium]
MTKKTSLSKKKPTQPSKPHAKKPSSPQKKAKPVPKTKSSTIARTASSSKSSSKSAPKKAVPTKKAAPLKVSVPKKSLSKAPLKKPFTVTTNTRGALDQVFVSAPPKKKKQILSTFLQKQQQRLLQLKDMLLDSMSGISQGHLHEGSDASAFGMHQADAGSDAYDRDFALSIISQEQNSLYEIDEALKRIDDGAYGICELCNKPIPHARLEARPFTRYTVGCQAELEKRQHVSGARLPVSALFGMIEEEMEHDEEEEGANDNHKE